MTSKKEFRIKIIHLILKMILENRILPFIAFTSGPTTEGPGGLDIRPVNSKNKNTLITYTKNRFTFKTNI